LAVQVDKMNLIKDCILERRDGTDVTAALDDCGRREVAFYTDGGHRAALAEINGLA